MPFPVLGSNSAVAGYEIDNSLRFNDGDSAYLGRTPSSASNRKTWTWSAWVKISTGTAHDHTFFSGGIGLGASGNRTVFRILSGELEKVMVFSGNTSQFAFKTSASLRDRSAWYHFVLAMDTTQSTDSNRFKMYINGSQVTDTAQLTYPSQNLELGVNTNEQHYIGLLTSDNNLPFDGYMADINFADGTQYAASDFGEYNDNGVWIPKEPNITYGTNGYRLEFKNSGALGTDTSGNGNDWTPTNLASFDVTTDTPTNNFCTMNPLATGSRGDFREGNSQVQTNVQGSVPYGQVEFGTFFVNTGKWYYEAKISSVGSGGKMGLGWNERYESGNYTNGHNNIGSNGNAFYSHQGDIKIGSGSDFSTGVDSYTTNDIIGCAIDLDNNKVYWHKNGNYQDDPTPTPTSNDGRSLGTATYNNTWTPWVTKDDTNNNCNVKFNFGNPPYTNSSSQSDDNGYGDFEYDVPTGFYSLCSKNLAEYG